MINAASTFDGQLSAAAAWLQGRDVKERCHAHGMQCNE